MTTKPFFSIITITRNNADGLRRTSSSITTQDMNDYEWIVIDGASTDGTMAPPGALFISEADDGLYDAMNKGLPRTTGLYVLFMNAGDSFAAGDTLTRLRNHVGNADFIYGDALETDTDGTIHYKRSRAPEKFTEGMITHHQAMIYRRAIIEGMRYNTHYTIAADFDFTFRALKKGHVIARLSFPVCVFEGGGVSQRQSLRGRYEQFIIRRAHKIGMGRNIAIFALQSALWGFRFLAPSLYWKMKARH